MPGLIDSERPPRRQMTLFFIIDKSGSMGGSKIGSVNDAIENVLPMIAEISDANTDAEIRVAALEFSNSTQWLYDEPKLANEFIWQPVQAAGMTSLGEACLELNKKLSRNGGFMSSPSGCYAPAFILLSDGGPTDNFDAGVKTLWNNSWFKNGIKLAISIDSDVNVLEQFTGSKESIVEVHNIEALKDMIKFMALTSSQIGSQSSTTAEKTKQELVEEKIKDIVDNTSGAQTAAEPKQGGDSYDEWD